MFTRDSTELTDPRWWLSLAARWFHHTAGTHIPWSLRLAGDSFLPGDSPERNHGSRDSGRSAMSEVPKLLDVAAACSLERVSCRAAVPRRPGRRSRTRP